MKPISEYQWRAAELEPELVSSLRKELDTTPTIATLLASVGVNTRQDALNFFNPKLSDLHSPYDLYGMQRAVARIIRAYETQEALLIYGDYDVDGTTSVACLYTFLKPYFENIYYYIPDRFTEGYGISIGGVDWAKKRDVSLLIALDCGTSQVDEIAYAKSTGIDTIVCDHHLPSGRLPDTIALINPKQEACSYPFDEMSACGLTYKLIHALSTQAAFSTDVDGIYDYLDYVALSTAADIVPMVGENRIFTYYGIRKMMADPRPCFKPFAEKKTRITVTDMVFDLAPKINAAGRMRHARFAVEMLIAEEDDDAFPIYAELSAYNEHRKELQEGIFNEAIQQIEQMPDDRHAIVVRGDSWNKGVVGIVASKIVERYHRPAFVFAPDGRERYVGSARTIDTINVYDILTSCSSDIINFGGHAHAAGITVRRETWDVFGSSLNKAVGRATDFTIPIPQISIHTEIELSEITPSFLEVMERMAPFGPQNMHPVFLARAIKHKGYVRTMGDGTHLKLIVYQSHPSLTFTCVGFGMGALRESVLQASEFDIAFVIENNEFRGEKQLNLMIRDIKFPKIESSTAE